MPRRKKSPRHWIACNNSSGPTAPSRPAFFEKSTESPDLGTRIYAAGHTLEFVTVALPSDELSEAWVVAGVNRLCDEMNAAREMEPDCGTLYHAAHSLRLYRDLRFGARRPHLAAN